MSEQDSDIPPKYSIGFFRSFARAFAPALVVLMFAPLLPMTPPENGIFGLEWYQQIVSLSTLPAIIWSLYRLSKLKKKRYKSPEERVLDEWARERSC